MTYQEYRKNFLQNLRDESAIDGSDTEDAFINKALDILCEYDEIQDPQRIRSGDKIVSKGRKIHLDGYSFDETDHSLVLFISDFEDSFDVSNLTMSRVDELYWRLYNFLDETCHGKMSEYFDDSDEMLQVASLVRERLKVDDINDATNILKIKFVILTNKELDTKLLKQNLLETSKRKTKSRKPAKTTKKIKKEDFDGKPLEINLWHLERFYEQEEQNLSEVVTINFEEDYKVEGIPCIKGNIGDDLGYQAYIAIIPGKLLADIYIDHGSKILEGNVRAFLGTSGSKSVNSGIRKTINNEPQNFFTYNNGIAATASNIEFVKSENQLYITEIEDLQIINGGQTTASLAESVLKKTNVDLEGIFVPMKLTVIEDRETEIDGIRYYDKMVQDIAKYANSQNKVTAADLFSNDPFHIKMEKMSKSYLAPAVKYSIPTAWYYERARKKYKQEQLKLKGDSLNRFLAKFPKEQIITKEQLAVYLTTMAQKPHIVAKGKNYVIKEFNQNIREVFGKNKDLFNEFFYHKSIASAIIFRSVDNYLEEHKNCAKNPSDFWYTAGGFKMDIVPYAIAKILSCIPSELSIDWEKIWKMQKIGPGFMKEIARATKFANDFINDSNGVIVSEYCKKPLTWEKFKEKPYTLGQWFLDELIPQEMVDEQLRAYVRDQRQTTGLVKAVDFIKKGPIYWTKILQLAELKKVVSNVEKAHLVKGIEFAEKAVVPESNKLPIAVEKMIDDCYKVRGDLHSLGLKV